MRNQTIQHEEYSFPWIVEIVKLAELYQVGNCLEKTCMAFMYLYEKSLELPKEKRLTLEIFNNPFVDHFFLVINRDILTNEIDPRLWNKSTIICDPWAKSECYSIQDVNFNNVKGRFQAIQYLMPINSSTGPIILEKNILGAANNVSTHIISQSAMVLRVRFNTQENLYTTHNTDVPMTYEAWDFPKAKDYKKIELIEIPDGDNESKNLDQSNCKI